MRSSEKRSPRPRLLHRRLSQKKLTIIEKRTSSSERKLRSPEPSSSCRSKTRSTERLQGQDQLEEKKTLKKQLKEVTTNQEVTEEVVQGEEANSEDRSIKKHTTTTKSTKRLERRVMPNCKKRRQTSSKKNCQGQDSRAKKSWRSSQDTQRRNSRRPRRPSPRFTPSRPRSRKESYRLKKSVQKLTKRAEILKKKDHQGQDFCTEGQASEETDHHRKENQVTERKLRSLRTITVAEAN